MLQLGFTVGDLRHEVVVLGLTLLVLGPVSFAEVNGAVQSTPYAGGGETGGANRALTRPGPRLDGGDPWMLSGLSSVRRALSAVETAWPGPGKCRRPFPPGERGAEVLEGDVVVEFLGRVAQGFRGTPQEGARRGVVDDHAIREVVPVGGVGGPWQGKGVLRGLGEVRCGMASQGCRRGEMFQDRAAGTGGVVGASGEVGSQTQDIAGEVLRVGGVLEQRGVRRHSRYMAALVEQLPLLGGAVQFVLHRVERADDTRGVVARYQITLEIGTHGSLTALPSVFLGLCRPGAVRAFLSWMSRWEEVGATEDGSSGSGNCGTG